MLYLCSITASAISVPGPGVISSGDSGSSTPSDGSSSYDHEHTATYDEETNTWHITCNHPQFDPNLFTPKLTALHSVNALVANSDYYNGVYYLPELEDIPLDLANICADVALYDSNGNIAEHHAFAYVYDGYYNSEVQIEQPQFEGYKSGTALTSKRVWSSTDNSRLLNLCGYDMLLQNEIYTLTYNQSTGDIDITYEPVLVSQSQPLSAQTIVMDLYKSVGQYEYKVGLAWGKDVATFGTTKSTRIEAMGKSPLLQGITYITGDVDVSEVKTYVAVTRTNPVQYWERFQRDNIMNGGQHTLTSSENQGIGSSSSVSRVYSQSSSMTGAEFCNLARAIMVLYGEKVPTEHELIIAQQAFSCLVPKGTYDDETYESIMYLLAKGIIDPDVFDFDAPVTFADIEYPLLRIADEDSRIETEEFYNANNPLAHEGYAEVKDLAFSDNEITVQTVSNASYYDVYVEVVDGVSDTYAQVSSWNNITWTDTGLLLSQGASVESYKDVESIDVGSLGMIRESDGSGISVRIQGIKELYIPSSDSTRQFYYIQVPANSVQEKSNVLLTTSSPSGFGAFFDKDGTLRGSTNANTVYDKGSVSRQITLPTIDGGIYLWDGSSYTYSSFKENNCLEGFIDSETIVKSGQLSSTAYIVSCYVPNSLLTQDNLTKLGNEDNLDYIGSSLEDSIARAATTPRDLSHDGTIKCSAFQLGSTESDKTRLEFTCIGSSAKKKVLNSKLLASVSDDFKSGATGYYRSSDNTLLVSLEYLKDLKLVSAYTVLPNESGYVLYGTKNGVNVTITANGDYIVVGNTMYPCNGETLFEKANNDVYVNYKACIGWTGNVLVISGDTDNVIVMESNSAFDRVLGAMTGNLLKYDMENIYTFFPLASTSTMFFTDLPSVYDKSSEHMLALSGDYVLAPYILVEANDNENDYLFVYHRRNIRAENEVVDTEAQEGDEAARATFQRVTGITLNSSDEFYLVCYPLNRRRNTSNVHRLTAEQNYKNTDTVTTTLGYVYDVPIVDSVSEAIRLYATGNHSEIMLPIVGYSTGNNISYYDVNLNVYKTDASEQEYRNIGYLPTAFVKYSYKPKDDKSSISLIKPDGTCRSVNSDVYPEVTLSGMELYAAPAGVWGRIQQLGQSDVKSLSSGTSLYYGTQKTQHDATNGMTINNRAVSLDNSATAYCTYYSAFGTSVYVTNAISSTIGLDIDLTAAEEAVEGVLGEPTVLIDWGQYKFQRLMENLDSWSTILLIFILNILPRVCMLLFFIIILLCFIKDVPFWRRFNQKHFDVYKFLTFGHQSIDTINWKKTVFTSMIALALFYMIMDGTLWNVIMWFCEIFLILSQR